MCAHQTALKNANELLKQIMKEVDTNHDGKIQYEGMLCRLEMPFQFFFPSFFFLLPSLSSSYHVPTANPEPRRELQALAVSRIS